MSEDDCWTVAKALVIGPKVGAGDGGTYVPRTPSVGELATALAAAEARGRIAGLREAEEKEASLNRLLDWCHMRLQPAYRGTFEKYRTNPLPPRDPTEPPLVISEATSAAMLDARIAELTPDPVGETAPT